MTKASFKIFHPYGLILEYYSGLIQLNDLLELKKQEIFDVNYNPNFNIIDDFRDAEFPMDVDGVKKYVDFVLKGKNFGKRNTAFLTDKPSQVVVSTLFNSYKKELPINIKTVSTLEYAAQFVGLKASRVPIIEQWFNSMRLSEGQEYIKTIE